MHSDHFSEAELQCRCGCGQNGCTPLLLQALEALRAALGGRSMRVNAAYRCATHNAAVGGVASSQHLLGNAADVSVPGLSAAELELVARQVPFIRGIGRDDHKGYLHVDVRMAPAHWCYRPTGKQCKYYPPAV